MSDTRRNFLHSTAVVAAGLTGAATLTAQAPAGRGGRQQQPAAPPRPASEIQVPKMKFGSGEISRLICGANQFYGFSHFNSTLSTVMQDFYTPERVCELWRQCNEFGIDGMVFHTEGRGQADVQRFLAQGGKMHLIGQGLEEPSEMIKTFKPLAPLAVYHHGSSTDTLHHAGKIGDVKEWCKRVRDMGTLVGVGSHNPEVIALVEDQGWDVDFFACCVYYVTRSMDEWNKVFNGELVELQRDCYLQSDPPRMYKVMRATTKPCFAFKILAAGRAANVEQAFRTAYESIKPNDGVFVGMFPRFKDEVRENAERVHRLLVKS
jgi:hypothetical protein